MSAGGSPYSKGVSTAYVPSTVELKRPRSTQLRDLTDESVRDDLEAEAIKDTQQSINRYLRARKRRVTNSGSSTQTAGPKA